MPTNHLTLIGAQALPVYNGLVYQKPDKTWLLHSSDTLQVAENLKAVCPVVCVLVQVENPFDYLACKKMITELIKQGRNAKWSFNISGGSKIMTIAALDVARENKFEVFFIDQNNLLTDLRSAKQVLIDSPIDLQVYFRLFGQSAKSSTKLNTVDNEYFKIANHISSYFFKFSSLFADYRKKGYDENKNFMLKNKHFELHWDKKNHEVMQFDELTGIETHMGGTRIFDVFFNTGWFELIVIDIIKEWPAAKQIYWHTVLPRTLSEGDKNEIDIIVDTGIKLLFFECKTNVHEIRDIDKFRNVVKNYGGLSAKPLLITNSKPNENILEKCQDNKVSAFWFHDTKTNEHNQPNQLIELLDKEYQNINPI